MSGAGAHKRGQQLAIRCAKLRREGLSPSEIAQATGTKKEQVAPSPEKVIVDDKKAVPDEFVSLKSVITPDKKTIAVRLKEIRDTTRLSELAEQALHSIGGLYEIERQALEMTDEDRWRTEKIAG